MPEMTLFYWYPSMTIDTDFLICALRKSSRNLEIRKQSQRTATVYRHEDHHDEPVCEIFFQETSEFTDDDWMFLEDIADQLRDSTGTISLEWFAPLKEEEKESVYAIVDRLQKTCSVVLEQEGMMLRPPRSWEEFKNSHK